MRFATRLLLMVVMLGVSTATSAAPPQPAPRITIIIDDLGYSLAAGRRAVELPGPVVCAVLPMTPRGSLLAELAVANGKEVLLHLPLQAGDEANTEPGQITLDMSRARLADTLTAYVDSVPFIVGINTHKGSLLTRHPGHMRWLMEEIDARRLVFVDSYTTHHSVALQTANEFGIPSARRDVFLDSSRRPADIAHQFTRLKNLARVRGSAIGIGHPYPATLSFLEAELPRLAEEGFELVGIRRLLGGRLAAAALNRGSAESSRAVVTGSSGEPVSGGLF